MTARAAVLVTGSELLRGGRVDENGPYLARELSSRGIEPERISVIGDRAEQLEAALRDALELDLVITSGGLGPTHDDRTIELLARAAGRSLRVDPELEREIESVVRGLAERFRRPYSEFEAGVRKQATLPEGGVPLGLAGTAPGVLLETDSALAIALPGPPGELQRIWRSALERSELQEVFARANNPAHRILRFFGLPESAVAGVIAEAGGESDGLEVTICAHDLEVQVDLVVPSAATGHAERVAAALREAHPRALFAEDEQPVEALVLDEARALGWWIATAESCTGGLVSARLTNVPGSSEVFRGGVVAYGDEVKVDALGVPRDVLERHGAVSPETAEAMARGAREEFEADVAVSVTGVAGPGGGSREKPVGLVYLHAMTPDQSHGVELRLPGNRDAVRRRAAVSALHLLRRLLTQSRHRDT
ncbi:MAG TPA: competence/damage-inducible protein A [Gaiellaceae bacterium]|nr:competence/damage-inducible protein A [Gaiellaceae bacterium]